ncbi:Sigma-fimbriae chaperone protein (plasmid) [Ralstonia solanacearum]|nr:Sigma-fimbriae chaperone protein [Ralstonia solanacearum]
MPADKLGRFMGSDLFLARANTAIAKAVQRLKERGIVPTYIQRPQSHEPKARSHSNVAQAPKSE